MTPAGKIAVISGGASGLGAATTTALIAAGAEVVVLDRQLLADAPHRHAYQCDICDEASTTKAIDDVMQRFGRIDIGINCAGIGGLGVIADQHGPQALAEFRRVIDVNLLGTVNVTRLVAHRMLSNEGDGADRERGVIINAASIASFEGQQGMGAYAASKAAIAALTLVWARDLSAFNVRVMSIAPGFFATPMMEGVPQPLIDDLLKDMEYPKRAGRADEFAELALFIIRSPLLNGATIRMDGATRPPARSRWTAQT